MAIDRIERLSIDQNGYQRTEWISIEPVYRLVNVHISEDRPLGIVRNSQSNMEEGPDPPENYRSMGANFVEKQK